MTQHSVPFKTRKVTRVTCNFFFQTTANIKEAFTTLLALSFLLFLTLSYCYSLILLFSYSLFFSTCWNLHFIFTCFLSVFSLCLSHFSLCFFNVFVCIFFCRSKGLQGCQFRQPFRKLSAKQRNRKHRFRLLLRQRTRKWLWTNATGFCRRWRIPFVLFLLLQVCVRSRRGRSKLKRKRFLTFFPCVCCLLRFVVGVVYVKSFCLCTFLRVNHFVFVLKPKSLFWVVYMCRIQHFTFFVFHVFVNQLVRFYV